MKLHKFIALPLLVLAGVTTSQAAITVFSDDMSDFTTQGWGAATTGSWEQASGYAKIVGTGSGQKSAGTLEAKDAGSTITVTFDWVQIYGPAYGTAYGIPMDAQLIIGGVVVDTVRYNWGDGSSTGNTLTAVVTSAQATGNDEVIVKFQGIARPGANSWAQNGVDNVALTMAAVPEPSSAVLLGLGGIALMMRRRK